MWNDLDIQEVPNLQKTIIISPTQFKQKRDNVVTLFDISYFRKEIHYHVNVSGRQMEIFYNNNFNRIEVLTDSLAAYGGTLINYEPHYPYVAYAAQGEDREDEPATQTVFLPPLETHLEFMERIQARLLHLTRRASVLRHELPHLSSRSRRVCLDLDDRDEYVHRYDHSINLLRLPCGYLQNMINGYQGHWNSHLEKVEDAKKKNQPEPKFTRLNERDGIEEMLEKLENTLTEEALIEHHETHDTTAWQNAHAARKIVLCDKNCGVGEELADINSYHTSGGVTNHRLAEQSFHNIAVTYWNQALQTPYRKLVTERTVTIA